MSLEERHKSLLSAAVQPPKSMQYVVTVHVAVCPLPKIDLIYPGRNQYHAQFMKLPHPSSYRCPYHHRRIPSLSWLLLHIPLLRDNAAKLALCDGQTKVADGPVSKMLVTVLDLGSDDGFTYHSSILVSVSTVHVPMCGARRTRGFLSNPGWTWGSNS